MGLIFSVISAIYFCCLMCRSPRISSCVGYFSNKILNDERDSNKSAQLLVASSAKIPLFCSTDHVFSPCLHSHFSLYIKKSSSLRTVRRIGSLSRDCAALPLPWLYMSLPDDISPFSLEVTITSTCMTVIFFFLFSHISLLSMYSCLSKIGLLI